MPTPLVASRAGALPEVVGSDGSAAVLVEPGDPSDLADALGSLLDDQPRRTALGVAGRRRVEARFTWSAVAAATAAAYTRGDRAATRKGPVVLTVDFEKFPIEPGERVLDLGCGAGRHAFEAVPARRSCRGLRPRRRRAGRGGRDVPGDGGGRRTTCRSDRTGRARRRARPAVPDGAFDKVIAAEVLEHIPDDVSAMAEIARVLRPGGRIAVSQFLAGGRSGSVGRCRGSTTTCQADTCGSTAATSSPTGSALPGSRHGGPSCARAACRRTGG